METPVIYIKTPEVIKEMIGFPFTDVLGQLVHMVDMDSLTEDQAKEWFQNFSWEKIPPNPNPAMLMRLRATSWNVIRRNQHLYDTSVRFGVVPMSPPLSLQDESKLSFYLVFSTSSKESLHLYGSNSHEKQSGKFNWRHWRSIESIFYHHPTAEVRVYSNTLPDNTFNVLSEAGYSIKVQKYSLPKLLKGTPAEAFIKKLEKASEGVNWYSNVSNLLRMLLLYRWGGIYIDTDVIVVKSLDLLKMNSIGWQTKNSMNGAILKFEKGNSFLKACMKDFANNYNGGSWGHNGPNLLTRVYHAAKWTSDVVNTVDHKLFYMMYWEKINKECFTDTNGSTFDANMNVFRTQAFVVHLNSKFSGNKGITEEDIKNGTLCKHLLNSFCVLCDQVH